MASQQQQHPMLQPEKARLRPKTLSLSGLGRFLSHGGKKKVSPSVQVEGPVRQQQQNQQHPQDFEADEVDHDDNEEDDDGGEEDDNDDDDVCSVYSKAGVHPANFRVTSPSSSSSVPLVFLCPPHLSSSPPPSGSFSRRLHPFSNGGIVGFRSCITTPDDGPVSWHATATAAVTPIFPALSDANGGRAPAPGSRFKKCNSRLSLKDYLDVASSIAPSTPAPAETGRSSHGRSPCRDSKDCLAAKSSPGASRCKSGSTPTSSSTARSFPKFLWLSLSKLMENGALSPPAADRRGQRTPNTADARMGFGRSSSSESVAQQQQQQLEDPDLRHQPDGGGSSIPAGGPEESFAAQELGEVPSTPNTLAFVEESCQRGLPLIPFQFPTAVIVEKIKDRNKLLLRRASMQRLKTLTSSSSSSSSVVLVNAAGSSSSSSAQAPRDPAGTDLALSLHRPLENLVDLARQELLDETRLGIRSSGLSFVVKNDDGNLDELPF